MGHDRSETNNSQFYKSTLCGSVAHRKEYRRQSRRRHYKRVSRTYANDINDGQILSFMSF